MSAMNQRPRRPLILIANNPFGHHLLTSQLLDLYKSFDLDTEVLLLCNGIAPGFDVSSQPWLKVKSFQTRFGTLASHIFLILILIGLRFSRPNAVFHLRGVIAANFFYISRMFMLGSARYIYDPRGAVFIERHEAGSSIWTRRLLAFSERRLIGNSLATIVTSNGFRRLYSRVFGYDEKYLTIYNATGFTYQESTGALPAQGPIRLIYLGMFNYWHDMDEVHRVMANAAQHLGPDRTEIYIYTANRLHDLVREKFSTIDCASLTVDYVKYHDIPDVLSDKHIGVSVVRPTLSTRIASPIKISDYIANGLVLLMNSGIGDFDQFYRDQNSAILYRFGQDIDLDGLEQVQRGPNKQIYDIVSRERSKEKLTPIVECLLHT